MSLRPGPQYLGSNRWRFRVWAPRRRRVALRLYTSPGQVWQLESRESGYFEVTVEAPPGIRYRYLLDDTLERSDPASPYQPEGVYGPSAAVSSDFQWTDTEWRGHKLADYIIYEIHTGLLTEQGTFEAAIDRLAQLRRLGITAIELMPVAQFPGKRNWGYDGVFLYAPQNTYGGPDGLRKLVDAAHHHGLAVVLDVVYNHLGPEGNYLADFGPYFTGRYRTPWGPAIDFDGPESGPVRQFFRENARYWIADFHIDALRFDAIHAITDRSSQPALAEMTDAVRLAGRELGRKTYAIAESAANDARVLRPADQGGLGFDAQWNDDFHHSLHALVTGERDGYYRDYGDLHQLAKAFTEGFVYTGQYSAFRKRNFGTPLRLESGEQLVVCSQNHDQVGNRFLGERLTSLVSIDGLKLSAGVVLLSPFVPLLFMGEEYGETAPFLFFTDFQDPKLAEAVRSGRRKEFAAFARTGICPDPQDEATFLQSALTRAAGSAVLLEFYSTLIRLRKSSPVFAALNPSDCQVTVSGGSLIVSREAHGKKVAVVYCFDGSHARLTLSLAPGDWWKQLDSSEPRWQGPGSRIPSRVTSAGSVLVEIAPRSLVVFANHELSE